MRTIALYAALLILVASSAQCADLCDTLAKTISSVQPPMGPPGPWTSPLHTLDKESRGVVVADREGWKAKTKDELLAELRTEYRASPELLEVVGQQWTDIWRPSLHRFGGSSLHLGQTIAGTAYCQRFVFFDAPPRGAGHVIEPPPIAATGDDTTFCWRRSGYGGEISGTPAFIVQSDQDNTVDLTVTPWRDGKWDKACRLTVTFENDFEANERFCRSGVDCGAMTERAMRLAEDLDKSPRSGFGIFNPSKLAGDAALDDQLPTFGGELHSSYREFFSDTMFLPIVVGEEMYLGRIGHAGFAWRRSTNYLFAAYRMTGHELEPVAGISIIKTRARPTNVKID